MNTISMRYGLLPVLIKLAVIALVWRFALDRARHAELQRRIGGKPANARAIAANA